MAENKKILPFAGLALAAFLLMGGKKASAAQSTEKVEDTIDKIPDGEDKPADDKPADKPNGGTKPAINPGPVTESEKQAVWWALNVIGTDVSSDKVPYPYNKKRPDQTMLDWKTNVAFWMTYVSPGAPDKEESLNGNYKLDPKTTPDYDYWSAVWLRIRNYIKSVAPTLK